MREYPVMNERTGNRLFPVLLLLLIAAGAFFGLAPFLLPTQFASFFGFAGVDVLMYRLAGAATTWGEFPIGGATSPPWSPPQAARTSAASSRAWIRMGRRIRCPHEWVGRAALRWTEP